MSKRHGTVHAGPLYVGGSCQLVTVKFEAPSEPVTLKFVYALLYRARVKIEPPEVIWHITQTIFGSSGSTVKLPVVRSFCANFSIASFAQLSASWSEICLLCE